MCVAISHLASIRSRNFDPVSRLRIVPKNKRAHGKLQLFHAPGPVMLAGSADTPPVRSFAAYPTCATHLAFCTDAFPPPHACTLTPSAQNRSVCESRPAQGLLLLAAQVHAACGDDAAGGLLAGMGPAAQRGGDSPCTGNGYQYSIFVAKQCEAPAKPMRHLVHRAGAEIGDRGGCATGSFWQAVRRL